MFWFKRKKIVLDCYTVDPFAFEYCQISKATNHYPEWWQNLPGTKSKIFDGSITPTSFATAKHCRGFIDLYRKSFILPMWGNILMDVGSREDRMFSWRCNFDAAYSDAPVLHHLAEQIEGYVDTSFQHIKLASPWLLDTNKKYVGFLMHDPLWNRSDLTEYSILSGVLDFKYQASSNVNLIAQFKEKPRKIHLRPGEPIAMLTPLSDNDIDVKCHLIDKSDIHRHTMQQRIFFPVSDNEQVKYSTVKKFIDKHEENNKPKCPFGFGK